MKASTLARAIPTMGLSRAKDLIEEVNYALWISKTPNHRADAMWLAQWEEESVGFTATQELGSTSYLQGQRYWPYIGRTFGQLTWDYNYSAFGTWLHSHGLLDDPHYFYNNPSKLADIKWAFLGPSWYWMTHGLNDPAARGDVDECTRIINGGYNGLSIRKANYYRIVRLGSALRPEEEMNEQQTRHIAREEARSLMRAAMLGQQSDGADHKTLPQIVPAKAEHAVLPTIERHNKRLEALEKKEHIK